MLFSETVKTLTRDILGRCKLQLQTKSYTPIAAFQILGFQNQTQS